MYPRISPTTNRDSIRRYLGLFNFYRRCIPKAADILELIVKLLEGHKNKMKHPPSKAPNPTEQLQWNDGATISFNTSKEAIAKATLLRHPIPGAQLRLWHSTVSIDRVKPAYLLADDTDQPELSQSQPILEKSSTAPPNPTKPSNITRCGHAIRFPKHLVADYIV
ncbi:hypothetical protein HNY73_003057 [Argiope bruennichi]|uniref:Uncharacterized protein n=1 Tax=Argiope bruennichi TaxID=94029 RepID=A0A8T0FY99_ARGBR|nr:hypothetical protein HNY73_003057 [Argiope bruennichi]